MPGARCLPCRAKQKREQRARARQDWAEHKSPEKVPPGYHVRGTSTLRNAAGQAVLTWEKTAADKDLHVQMLMDAVHGVADKLPREPLIAAPAHTTENLLAAYLIGDPHIGMYSWAPETSNDFDLTIAERELVGAVDYLVGQVPACAMAIVFNAGDFFHSDNQSNRTNRSGASLDVDGRWSKVLAVGIRIMCRVIDRALERHDNVIVRNEIGNHDDHTSIMLAQCLAHHYGENPRVLVDTSPAKFWYCEWGACLFGTTHGDTCKPPKLPEVMAADMPEAWGRTRHRRWYTGHVHHESVKDYPGCTVETLRTFAPGDAWHRAHGYRSPQDMRCDVWHREHGLLDRKHAPIELVRELVKK